MALVETEAIVLRTYGLAEADKIVVMLTRAHGLVRGVAKGAKRLKSRFGSSLEPFSVVRAVYFQKEDRELVSVRGIEIDRSYFTAASDPSFLSHFAYAAELLSEFALPADPDERLFRMTRVCLETAAARPDRMESVIVYFELWLLRLGGYLPDWSVCDGCKLTLDDEGAVLLPSFQLLCRRCVERKGGHSVTHSERTVYLSAQRLAPSDFVEFVSDKKESVRAVSDILKRMIVQIVGRERSPAMMLAAGPQER